MSKVINIWLNGYDYEELVFRTFEECNVSLGDFEFVHNDQLFNVFVRKGYEGAWFTFEVDGQTFATNNVWNSNASVQNVKNKPQDNSITILSFDHFCKTQQDCIKNYVIQFHKEQLQRKQNEENERIEFYMKHKFIAHIEHTYDDDAGTHDIFQNSNKMYELFLHTEYDVNRPMYACSHVGNGPREVSLSLKHIFNKLSGIVHMDKQLSGEVWGIKAKKKLIACFPCKFQFKSKIVPVCKYVTKEKTGHAFVSCFEK